MEEMAKAGKQLVDHKKPHHKKPHKWTIEEMVAEVKRLRQTSRTL
jgi:hypothetical protein